MQWSERMRNASTWGLIFPNIHCNPGLIGTQYRLRHGWPLEHHSAFEAHLSVTDFTIKSSQEWTE